jgi:hypothetical protein
LYPDTSNNNLAGFSKGRAKPVPLGRGVSRVSQWAATAATLVEHNDATSEDADLDGEAEHLLFNDRVFAMFERIGGRMTCAFVRDLSSGRVLQVVGNPHSYAGFETEEEGVGECHQRRGGQLSHQRLQRLVCRRQHRLQQRPLHGHRDDGNGFIFTSSDGKIAKTITLAVRANALFSQLRPHRPRNHALPAPRPQPAFAEPPRQRPDASRSCQQRRRHRLADQFRPRRRRAHLRPRHHRHHLQPRAIDDDPVTTFDTLTMRNQAQTQQVEFSLTNGATFDLGFETGPTLSESTDGDAPLPDVWEAANNLLNTDGTGSLSPPFQIAGIVSSTAMISLIGNP